MSVDQTASLTDDLCSVDQTANLADDSCKVLKRFKARDRRGLVKERDGRKVVVIGIASWPKKTRTIDLEDLPSERRVL